MTLTSPFAGRDPLRGSVQCSARSPQASLRPQGKPRTTRSNTKGKQSAEPGPANRGTGGKPATVSTSELASASADFPPCIEFLDALRLSDRRPVRRGGQGPRWLAAGQACLPEPPAIAVRPGAAGTKAGFGSPIRVRSCPSWLIFLVRLSVGRRGDLFALGLSSVPSALADSGSRHSPLVTAASPHRPLRHSHFLPVTFYRRARSFKPSAREVHSILHRAFPPCPPCLRERTPLSHRK